jgi:O-methyltransferase
MTLHHNANYLDLLAKTLTFSMWPEPPRPVGITARRDIVARTAKMLDRVLNRFGLTLCALKPHMRRDVGLEWPLLAHTMVGQKRLQNIRELCEAVDRNGIPGAFVECGVWRGGASIYARACLKPERQVICCDSFQGLPHDPSEPEYATFDFLRVSRQQVEQAFRDYELHHNVRFVEGWFSDTLKHVNEPIAILRADGDMFSSTMTILGDLYDKVSPGGYVIIDDYILKPCAEAVEFFRAQNRISAPLVEIDECSCYWRKPTTYSN